LILTAPLLEAVDILKRGGVVAYPTETVYGLGCDATNEKAVRKLFKIKGRPEKNPIPVLIASKDELPIYVLDVPAVARAWIEDFWPGPLTLVFRAASKFAPSLVAGTDKIALRVSSHPVAGELVRQLGLPLTTTSANRSGQAPARSAQEVGRALEGVDAVVDGGELIPSPASTVVDVTFDPPRVLRVGEISEEELMKGKK